MPDSVSGLNFLNLTKMKKDPTLFLCGALLCSFAGMPQVWAQDAAGQETMPGAMEREPMQTGEYAPRGNRCPSTNVRSGSGMRSSAFGHIGARSANRSRATGMPAICIIRVSGSIMCTCRSMATRKISVSRTSSTFGKPRVGAGFPGAFLQKCWCALFYGAGQPS